MQYRHLFPMVRILLPYLAGIIVSISTSATSVIPVFVWISLMLLTVVAGFFKLKSFRFVTKWFFGLVLSLFLFVSGFNSVVLHKEILKSGHFSKSQNSGTFIAVVSEPIQEKAHSYKTILRVKAIKNGNKTTEAEGRILTYFAKDTMATPPPEGSVIIFSGEVLRISPPQNPGTFDYQKYMASNNVYHQVFLKKYEWRILEKPNGFNLYRTAHIISRNFTDILKDNGLKGREYAVASALILGQNDMLDNETLQAYSGSGVMHILSVSGLHVGVLYIVINFLLGFLNRKGRQLYLKTVLIILTIWAYAVLTGLSPSVMRAAAMFSFIAIGDASKRYVHIINSLAVSAFILLLINPLIISNIGFQLSFLAILGIIYINKPIDELYNPANRVTEYIWGLISVSIAAQITTAPLAMLYFHQFPLYFIPANLVAIPLSFLAIYAGLSVLVTSFIPAISSILGLITNSLLFVLNYSVEYIEKLPYAVIHVFSVSPINALLIYSIIASFIILIYYRKKTIIYIALGLILILSVNITATEISRSKQKKIIFYSTNKQSVIGFITGKEQVLLADSVFFEDETSKKYSIEGTRSYYGIKTSVPVSIDTITNDSHRQPIRMNLLQSIGNHIVFHNKRIMILNNALKPAGDCKRLKIDFLVLKGNPKFQIHDLIRLYQPGMIVIDGSNSKYRTDKWLAECKQAGINAYSIKNKGALVVDL